MFHLTKFLCVFHLRFGCRVIGFSEIILYGSGFYFLIAEHGLRDLLKSILIIIVGASLVISVFMLLGTLQGRESSGIVSSYLIWGIFSTTFYVIFYVLDASTWPVLTPLKILVFFFVVVALTTWKCYALLVVYSLLHWILNVDSDDSQ